MCVLCVTNTKHILGSRVASKTIVYKLLGEHFYETSFEIWFGFGPAIYKTTENFAKNTDSTFEGDFFIFPLTEKIQT